MKTNIGPLLNALTKDLRKQMLRAETSRSTQTFNRGGRKMTHETKNPTFAGLLEHRTEYTVVGKGKEKHIDCNDVVAKEMRELTLDDAYSLCSGLGLKGLKEKYSALNHGQQRMNVGNRLRKLVKDQNVKSLSELVPITEAPAKEKKEKKAPAKSKGKRAKKAKAA